MSLLHNGRIINSLMMDVGYADLVDSIVKDNNISRDNAEKLTPINSKPIACPVPGINPPKKKSPAKQVALRISNSVKTKDREASQRYIRADR